MLNNEKQYIHLSQALHLS